MEKYRQAKMRHIGHDRGSSTDAHMKIPRSSRHSPPPEDPRLKHRPPEPPEPASAPTGAPAAQAKKKKKEKEVSSVIQEMFEDFINPLVYLGFVMNSVSKCS